MFNNLNHLEDHMRASKQKQSQPRFGLVIRPTVKYNAIIMKKLISTTLDMTNASADLYKPLSLLLLIQLAIYQADPLQHLLIIFHQRTVIYKQQRKHYHTTMDHVKLCHAQERAESLLHRHLRWIFVYGFNNGGWNWDIFYEYAIYWISRFRTTILEKDNFYKNPDASFAWFVG